MKKHGYLLFVCLLMAACAGASSGPIDNHGWNGAKDKISTNPDVPPQISAAVSPLPISAGSPRPADLSSEGRPAYINDFRVNQENSPSVFVQFQGDLACSRWPAKVWTVWKDLRSPNGDIYLQRFDSLMLNRLGPNVKVNDDTVQCYQGYPSIDCDSLGNAVVVWSDGRWTYGYGQRFGYDGTRWGQNFRLMPDTILGYCYYSDVAMMPQGRFAVSTIINSFRYGRMITFLQLFNNDGSMAANHFSDTLLTESQNWSAAGYGGNRLVVVWYGFKNSRWDIYARIYDGLGTPVTGAFRVSDLTANISYPFHKPGLAVNTDGSFIIVWPDNRGGDYDIYGQMYDANGNPNGPNFRVNINPAGHQLYPQAYYVKDGPYQGYLVISWYEYEQQYIHGIMANTAGGIIFDGVIAPTDAYPVGQHRLEFCYRPAPSNDYIGPIIWDASLPDPISNQDVWTKNMNSGAAPAWRCHLDSVGAYQYQPSVSADSIGRWAVAWCDMRLSSGKVLVMGRGYNPDGTPISEETNINDTTMSVNYGSCNLHFAVNPRGDFACVWNDNKSITGMIGSFDTGPIPGNFRVSADTSYSNYKQYPKVALDPDGNFISIWLDSRYGVYDIYCRGFLSNAIPTTSEDVKVNPDGVNIQYYSPKIAFLGSGRYGLFYAAYVENLTSIFCRLAQLQSNGLVFVGAPFKVSDNLSHNAGQFGVAADPQGNFFLAWGEWDIYRLRGRWFDRDGNPLVPSFDITNDWEVAVGNNVEVTVDRQARSAVVWNKSVNYDYDAGDVYARLYKADRTPYTPAFRISQGFPTYYQNYPAVAAGGGKFYFAWEDGRYDTCGTDIFAKGYTWEELGVAQGPGSELKVGSLKLLPNAPNPFSKFTKIKFQMPKSGLVSLRVYNAAGQVVRTLVSGYLAAGEHGVVWDGRDEAGRDAANGVYLYRLEAGQGVAVRRMTLLR